ncbi:coiled-coil domain-containing protein 96 isoform X1 [Labrus bergylta]|uniref:coiled-coil domain-containing protein 96 isoform X1 n=1 Tax=Labrus bergylta TaxID=56723 RepID=UPI003313A30E
MDSEPENTESEVKNDTDMVSAGLTNNEEFSSFPDNGNRTVPVEIEASGHDEEIPESVKATEEAPDEEGATSEPEENTADELPDSNPDFDMKVNTANELPMSHEESVVFEINSTDDGGPPRLHLESPDKETTSPQEEEDEAEEEEPSAAEKAETSYKEYAKLLQELCEQRHIANQRSSLLQVKLVEYFRKKGGDDVQVEREKQASEQLQEYERCMNMLMELKQQINTESESAQQQEDELRVQSQEKLEKVDKEWRAFVALKQDVAVSLLGRLLGKQAAQAKVESTLAGEQLRQDELIKLRLKHRHLRMKIHRLEAELRDRDDKRDPLQLQFERLQAERLELRKQTEKQHEESLKIRKKISSSLEVLSNVKEKLSWGQMEVQAKKEQLAEVEVTLARKRELLTRIKKTRNGLQRDNLRLKERGGLLGNRALLRDFEDTVDSADLLEEKLENLKLRLSVAGGRKT